MAIVYVHIGTHKTGTTTLQKFLFEHRQELESYNIVYPEIGMHPGLKGHHPIAFYLAGKRSYFRKTLPGLEISEVVAEFSQTLKNNKNIVISSEDFSRQSLPFLRNVPSKLKSYFPARTEFRILVYLRRQDKFINSYYRWQRKNGRMLRSKLNMRYVRSIKYFPYSKILRIWSKEFGEECVVVRPFERASLHGGSLISDFLSQIGISDWKSPLTNQPHLNVAYTVRQLEALDYLRDVLSGPHFLISRFCRGFVKEFSGSLNLKSGPENPLEPRLANEILKKFSDDNRWIARKYLDRCNLFIENSISPVNEDRQSLTDEDFQRIDKLLASEVERFNVALGANLNGKSEHSGNIRVRSSIFRKKFEFGATRFRAGRIVRLFNILLHRLKTV